MNVGNFNFVIDSILLTWEVHMDNEKGLSNYI